MNHTISSAYLLERISMLQYRKRKLRQNMADSELRRQTRESRETKAASVYRTECQRGKRCSENPRDLQRVLLEYSTNY